MTKRILIFGNLEDIIFIKEEALLLLCAKIVQLNTEIGALKGCPLSYNRANQR